MADSSVVSLPLLVVALAFHHRAEKSSYRKGNPGRPVAFRSQDNKKWQLVAVILPTACQIVYRRKPHCFKCRIHENDQVTQCSRFFIKWVHSVHNERRQRRINYISTKTVSNYSKQ